VDRSKLCFFPRPGDVGFCNDQFEESSNAKKQRVDIIPTLLFCLGTRLQAHVRKAGVIVSNQEESGGRSKYGRGQHRKARQNRKKREACFILREHTNKVGQ